MAEGFYSENQGSEFFRSSWTASKAISFWLFILP